MMDPAPNAIKLPPLEDNVRSKIEIGFDLNTRENLIFYIYLLCMFYGIIMKKVKKCTKRGKLHFRVCCYLVRSLK